MSISLHTERTVAPKTLAWPLTMTAHVNTWTAQKAMLEFCLLIFLLRTTPFYLIILANRVAELGSPDYLVTMIMSLLTGKKRHVKIGDTKSSGLTSNTGAHQGCALSPFLFSVYLIVYRLTS